MSRQFVIWLVVFNVIALGLLIKDHFITPPVSAVPVQMGPVSGAVVTVGDLIQTEALEFEDMPGMSVTADFPGGDLVILFTAESIAFAELEIRALVDDEEAEPGDVTISSSPLEAAGGFIFVAPDIEPGTHTVKIQWHKEEPEGQELIIEDRTLLVFTVGP